MLPVGRTKKLIATIVYIIHFIFIFIKKEYTTDSRESSLFKKTDEINDNDSHSTTVTTKFVSLSLIYKSYYI